MGFSGVSPLSLFLILMIIVCLFGTKKLKSLGTDLGQMIKCCREAMMVEEEKTSTTQTDVIQTQADVERHP